jgi:glycosyltransferase involved in cell wall biosynthesis
VNVALLNAWFWPEVRRGSERLVHDLAVDLLALGHRPRLLTSHPSRRRTSTVEDGFEVVRSPRPPERLLALRNFQNGISHLPLSYRELRRGDDDVAHAFYPTDAVAAVRWGERSGRPVVFSYMGIPRRDALANQRLRLAIHEQATTRADAVTVLSVAARDAMWRWLRVEAEIVAPGVDLELFCPGGQRAEHPTLACAGDPGDARKRAPLLVEAFGIVRRSVPDARLILMRPRDERLARQLEEGGATLVEVDSRGVVDVFRSAWATGLASYGEAFGLVVAESLACGTPVFGPDDGGVAEIVDRPEVGALFDAPEPESVARAMLAALALAGDPATAAACRARAEDFDTMSGARAYAAIYERLLASRRPA